MLRRIVARRPILWGPPNTASTRSASSGESAVLPVRTSRSVRVGTAKRRAASPIESPCLSRTLWRMNCPGCSLLTARFPQIAAATTAAWRQPDWSRATVLLAGRRVARRYRPSNRRAQPRHPPWSPRAIECVASPSAPWRAGASGCRRGLGVVLISHDRGPSSICGKGLASPFPTKRSARCWCLQ